jgi:hypothetical protein
MKEFKSKPVKGLENLDDVSLLDIARLENLEKFRNHPEYKEWIKKGGEVAGKKNVESGQIQKIQKQYAHLGGKISGKLSYENKTGIHSDEVKEKYRKEYIEPKKGMFDLEFQSEKGKHHYEKKKGIHGLSKEETLANAKKGGQAAAAVCSKAVLQYSKDGEFIKEHKSLSDGAEYVGKERGKGCQIGLCCRGKQKTAFGFIWKYKNK